MWLFADFLLCQWQSCIDIKQMWMLLLGHLTLPAIFALLGRINKLSSGIWRLCLIHWSQIWVSLLLPEWCWASLSTMLSFNPWYWWLLVADASHYQSYKIRLVNIWHWLPRWWCCHGVKSHTEFTWRLRRHVHLQKDFCTNTSGMGLSVLTIFYTASQNLVERHVTDLLLFNLLFNSSKKRGVVSEWCGRQIWNSDIHHQSYCCADNHSNLSMILKAQAGVIECVGYWSRCSQCWMSDLFLCVWYIKIFVCPLCRSNLVFDTMKAEWFLNVDPILAYSAGAEVSQLQWSTTQPDWVAICFANKTQILRVWGFEESAKLIKWQQ